MAESRPTLVESRPASPPPPRSRFEWLASWSFRHRWSALAAWVLVLAGVTVASQVAGPDYHNDFSLPGTESQEASDILQARAPAQSGGTVQIVVSDPGGLRNPAAQERIEAMIDEAQGLPHVANVSSPYTDQNAISQDGTIGYATVLLDAPSEEVPNTDIREIIATAQDAETGDLRVELAGDAVRAAQEGEGGAAEGVGILAALVILVLLFGSLLAASLPIVIGIFAVGSAFGLIVLASHVSTVSDFTTPLMFLVGLGVGIDYALLVFSRYRSEILHGVPREQAVRVALDTAGRTVFFAASTVIIALLGLVVLGLGSLQGVAVAVALTVLVTMIASLTLLPALLAIMGKRIDKVLAKRAAKAKHLEGHRWRQWSKGVQRYRWVALVLSLAALLALCIPALGIHLGFADAGNDPKSTTSRQAYDLLAQGFGPGANGPLLIVVDGNMQAAGALQGVLQQTPGIAAAAGPIPSQDGQVAMVIVFPTSKPQDKATQELVTRLRTEVLPPIEAQTGARMLVGGATAAVVDFAGAVAQRLWWFVLVVVGLSALLLMLVFRSLLIPVKAAVLNLLSVGAALGVITLVFQRGYLGDVLGVEPGPIEAFVPVLIFAIAFGLSMDYEVFLLSRMDEEWLRTRDAGRAVNEGIATTGRVVTAAAAIMIMVFGSFLLDPGRMLKQFGLGLAVAIFVDALIIRCLLLPAVMHLFGRAAWWLPGPLARRLPRVAIERS